MHSMSQVAISQVAIVGGTHGNELTGIYLVKKFERNPTLVERSSFQSMTLLANPQAFAARRRYVDTDLNRCFQKQTLENLPQSGYEAVRAREIYQLLTTTGKPQSNFIIDLHSSTANMGLTIIPSSQHPFNLQLAAYLTSINPAIKTYRWAQADEDSPFLRSVYPLGCAIEVGPVAQGLLDATLFQQAESLIYAILDYIEAYNRGQSLPTQETFTIYQCFQTIDYPKTDAGLTAMIHPQLQSKDYKALPPGAPLFLTFEGQTITYQGDSIVYPVFINEAAYYEKGIAMCLTQMQQVNLNQSAMFESP